MTVNISKLRAISENYFERMTIEEVRHQLDAIPALIAVYEAVEKWRDAPCDALSFCERGDHEFECTVSVRERELCRAIDITRGAAP